MFGFTFSKILSTILPYLIIIALSAIVYFYVKGLQEDVKTLTADNAALELSVKAQEKAIEAQRENLQLWEDSQAKMQVQIEKMAKIAVDARSESRRLQDVFSKHNLEVLARKKPTLVERRINSGTDRVRRMLECQTSENPDCSSGPR